MRDNYYLDEVRIIVSVSSIDDIGCTFILHVVVVSEWVWLIVLFDFSMLFMIFS